ncbi:MAG TPA: hypothetical protein HA282_05395 [Nanoarchaeota archaeon]|nr:MAG: hypothetical protein QT01_C0001G0150 [archaeon GW2011_AR6]MBS3082939.1 hypothetical protein [Candidatus Pacearchaeota archaeon]HIH17576.1 hypothetical protein [Nanoarchaeota archaeon]HIH33897.1 hypothetical protein [Nanoarchaeota archaeon]HIH51102.1 hypothetical protein [Nanoarchaeota archaeon]
MVSAVVMDLFRTGEERRQILETSPVREKDVLVRKCSKCGGAYCTKVNVDNSEGGFQDGNVVYYCNMCFSFVESCEIGVE